MGDPWDPEQYGIFRDERAQPFHDLLALVVPDKDMRVVDLGCGTGELTAQLAARLPGAVVLGVDSSPSMLEKAAEHASSQVMFQLADIGALRDWAQWDLVFSNAALQWVPDHERLLAEMFGGIRPGAQVAVQMPRNGAHPSHRVAAELASLSAWTGRLDGFVRVEPTLTAERYAELLHAHGFKYTCFEKVYGHHLESTRAIVDWVRGTLLTPYLGRLDPSGQREFIEAYRDRLLAELGDEAPYFYPFRRLLFWGRKAAAATPRHPVGS